LRRWQIYAKGSPSNKLPIVTLKGSLVHQARDPFRVTIGKALSGKERKKRVAW
jgi:hypothetical protein